MNQNIDVRRGKTTGLRFADEWRKQTHHFDEMLYQQGHIIGSSFCKNDDQMTNQEQIEMDLRWHYHRQTKSRTGNKSKGEARMGSI